MHIHEANLVESADFNGREDLERTFRESDEPCDEPFDAALQELHLTLLREGKGANPEHVLYLNQRRPERRRFPISSPTQLGRWTLKEWARKDKQPSPFFEFINHLILIQGCNSVSRNHAIVYPLRGDYFITDLKSTNGTSVNGRGISSPRKLSPGDAIGISSLELTVSQASPQYLNNHALFVGDPGWNLRGIQNDMDKLAQQLRERGFGGNIIQMYKPEKDEVLGALEGASQACSNNAHFIFYFSGHGNRYGIIANNEAISPGEIYERLERVQGKKSVILDCCHAGVFNPHDHFMIYRQTESLIPPNTMVIVASTSDQHAYEQPQPVFGGLIMGNLTAGIVQFLIENRGELDFRSVGDYLSRHNGTFYFTKQTPAVAGASFTIHLARTESSRRK